MVLLILCFTAHSRANIITLKKGYHRNSDSWRFWLIINSNHHNQGGQTEMKLTAWCGSTSSDAMFNQESAVRVADFRNITSVYIHSILQQFHFQGLGLSPYCETTSFYSYISDVTNIVISPIVARLLFSFYCFSDCLTVTVMLVARTKIKYAILVWQILCTRKFNHNRILLHFVELTSNSLSPFSW